MFNILINDILASWSKTEMNFRKKMDYARPDVVERMAANAEKGELAMRLRGLRDAAGMTQEDIMLGSGLRMDEVEALEALTGAAPSAVMVEKYIAATKAMREL
jgi:hypothetical protein